jgi:hypothetical protein
MIQVVSPAVAVDDGAVLVLLSLDAALTVSAAMATIARDLKLAIIL